MNRKRIYNPESNESVNDRKIFGGNPTSMFELNKIKYQWAYQLWKTMLANTWFPEEVNMNQDKKDYNHKLTVEEKTGYDRALAQLIFMDSLQANNLIDNVNPYITSPEINLVLVRQAYEECLIEGTEILTTKGFKDFRDLKETDLVANFDIEKYAYTYKKPSRIIVNDHDGDMIKLTSNNVEQIVTPNHRVVYRNRDGKLVVCLAKDLNVEDIYNLPAFPGVNQESEVSKETINYKGKVYCCEVDTGVIVCKYNNTQFITGNCLHSQSYAVMVESISANTDDIYELWRKDMILKSKNDYIANVYEQLSHDPSDEALIKAFYANQILEGIYFYSGFSYFYTLARAGKMLGTSQMIRFIQRDEITHLSLFQNLINSVKKERPELFTNSLIEEVVEMFRKAVEIETSWGEYITQGSILGLTDEIINNYIKYLADNRMKRVGLPTLYNVEHPLKWVEQFSNLNNHKTNFFEAKVTNYAKGSLNLDDF